MFLEYSSGTLGYGQSQDDGLKALKKSAGRFHLLGPRAKLKPGDDGVGEFLGRIGRLQGFDGFSSGRSVLENLYEDVGVDQDHQRDLSRRRVC
ncbi:MAG: hypothetical protein A2V88_05400 [Elusimicrobia bacterium RBG_16_66_12]|nr:MAG: hypothetical protein A2V88_05400 [Elusimicrobia bacterium RBG_16_66_12]